MCQCGCGEFPVTKAYRLPNGNVIGIGFYRGCPDCFAGLGVSVYVYPDEKSEWLEGAEIEDYKPDEYGGNHGHGISLSFFEVKDLIKAVCEIGEDLDITVEEWLEENGFDMLQKGQSIFEKRIKHLDD